VIAVCFRSKFTKLWLILMSAASLQRNFAFSLRSPKFHPTTNDEACQKLQKSTQSQGDSPLDESVGRLLDRIPLKK
jgi:hypothetical protein